MSIEDEIKNDIEKKKVFNEKIRDERAEKMYLKIRESIIDNEAKFGKRRGRANFTINGKKEPLSNKALALLYERDGVFVKYNYIVEEYYCTWYHFRYAFPEQTMPMQTGVALCLILAGIVGVVMAGLQYFA